MLNLLDGMLARGVPIHGIGLQAHLRADQATALGDKSYEAFLGELARRGMKIFVTELDVQDGTLPADTGARDQAVAQIYRRFLSATLRQPAVRGIVTWGLADPSVGSADTVRATMVYPCGRCRRCRLPAQSGVLRDGRHTSVSAAPRLKRQDG